jgi:hypothetical protein
MFCQIKSNIIRTEVEELQGQEKEGFPFALFPLMK